MSNEIKRMNYYDGLLLKQEDLTLDQNYHMQLRRIHNRYFHDWGIVTGLDVTAVEGLTQVKVSPGLALNRVKIDGATEEISQEILIYDNHPDRTIDLSKYGSGDEVYIAVSYQEEKADVDTKKGGEPIHIWECSKIEAIAKPFDEIDVKSTIILARVIINDSNINKSVEVSYVRKYKDPTIKDAPEIDIDLRTYAVLEGRAVEIKKLTIGDTGSNLPYIEELSDTIKGNGLNVQSPFTRFTGTVEGGTVKAAGNVEVSGSLIVKSNNNLIFKADPEGIVDIKGAVSIGGEVTGTGGLKISGKKAAIDTTELAVTSNTVSINQYTPKEDETEPRKLSSGFEVYRLNADKARLVWDESDQQWKAGTDKENDMHQIAYGPSWDKLKGGVNVDELHKHSNLSSPLGDNALSVDNNCVVEIKNSISVSEKILTKDIEVKRPVTYDTQNNEIDNNGKLVWNESITRWQAGIGQELYDLPYGSEWNELTEDENADGLHKHGSLYSEDSSIMAMRVSPLGDIDVTNSVNIGKDLNVLGNLKVEGTTTTVNSVQMEVDDNVIVINKKNQDLNEGGVEVYRGVNKPNARIVWNEGSDSWKIGTADSMYEIPYGADWGELVNGKNVDALHNHSSLYTEKGTALAVDENGDVEAEGNVVVNGSLTVDKDTEIKGTLSVDSSLIVEGNLSVRGTTTTVNTKNLEVNDRFIVVNRSEGLAVDLTSESGVEVYRGGTVPNARLAWDEKEGKWKIGIADDMTDIACGEEWQTLTEDSQADGLHRHSTLIDKNGKTILEVDNQGKIKMDRDAKVNGALSVDGTMTVSGDLVVQGKTTTISKTDLQITDNVILLNKDNENSQLIKQSGFEVYRGNGQEKACMLWDEDLKAWKAGLGENLKEVICGSEWKNLIGKGNVDTLHLHGQLYNEKGNILALSSDASGNIDVAREMMVGQDLTVLGNLDVRGSLVSLNTEKMEVRGSTIIVNRFENGQTPLEEKSGIKVFRGEDAIDATLLWDNTTSRWEIGEFNKTPSMIINSDGSVITAGRLTSEGANIKGTLLAENVDIKGSLTIKTGLEVPMSSGTNAQVIWDSIKNCWKIGTVYETGISVTEGGSVGIGTDTPTTKMDIKGNMAVSGTASIAETISAKNLAVTSGLTVGDSLSLNVDGIEVVRKDEKGNVIEPAKIKWNGKKWQIGTGDKDSMQDLTLGSHKHTNLYTVNEIPVVNVSSDGKVGIGTQTPQANMQVKGTVIIDETLTVGGGKLILGDGLTVTRANDAKAAKLVWDETSRKWQAGIEGSQKEIAFVDHKHSSLWNNTDQIVAVNNTGDVTIGKNETSNSKLEVYGSINTKNVTVEGDVKAATGNITNFNASSIESTRFNVTTANITNAAISKDLTVGGNLIVNGESITLNTKTLEVEDNILRINKYDSSVTPVNTKSGLEVYRGGTAEVAQIIWDEENDCWKAGLEKGLKKICYSDHNHQNQGLIAASATLTGDVSAANGELSGNLTVKGIVKAQVAQTSSQSNNENIVPLAVDAALELLNDLVPVTFDYKADSVKKHNIGFIAEDVPEIFSTSEKTAVTLMDIIGVLTTVVKNQQTETAALKGSITALQSEIAKLKGSITSLQTEATAQKGSITALQSDTTTMKGNVTALQTDATAQKGSITALQSDTTTIKANVIALQTDATAQKGSITTLQSDTTAIKANVTTLQTKTTAVEGSITTLQKQVEALKA